MATGLDSTSTDASPQDTPDGSKPRNIVIVSHDRPELFDQLTQRFQNSPDTSIVRDDDVKRLDLPVDSDGWRSIDALLSVTGYTMVRTS